MSNPTYNDMVRQMANLCEYVTNIDESEYLRGACELLADTYELPDSYGEGREDRSLSIRQDIEFVIKHGFIE